MPEDLKEMFRQAQAAEESVAQTKQIEEAQVKKQGEADLDAQLKERELLLSKAGETEQKRADAAELLGKAKETAAGKEKVTAEMEEFMRVAANSIQEREAQLAVFEKQIEAIDANPAVIDRLREQAEEEGHRIELQKEFWIKPRGGSIYSVLGQGSKEYRTNIEGRHSGDSALVQLESYAMHATGMMKGEEVVVPLAEAEDVIRRWSEIRQEADSGDPDVRKIDSLLSEFLYKRLQHFSSTFGQRVEMCAQQLHQWYQEHPDRPHLVEKTVEDWKRDLSNSVPEVNSALRMADMVMSGKDWKAKTLAKIGEDISSKTRFLGKASYPFFADNFKEPKKEER